MNEAPFGDQRALRIQQTQSEHSLCLPRTPGVMSVQRWCVRGWKRKLSDRQTHKLLLHVFLFCWVTPTGSAFMNNTCPLWPRPPARDLFKVDFLSLRISPLTSAITYNLFLCNTNSNATSCMCLTANTRTVR